MTKKINRRAFTLVELLVVIAIIGLLSTVAVVATKSSGSKSRDTKRKADLVQISKALELYYATNNSYPSTGGAWQGNCSTYGSLPDSGAGAWIPNFTAYMAQLPHDPDTGKPRVSCLAVPTWACYLYRSDDGRDYKILAHCTPENGPASTDPFYDPYHGGSFSLYTPGAASW